MDSLNNLGPTGRRTEMRPKPSRFRVAFWFCGVALILAIVVGSLYGFNHWLMTTRIPQMMAAGAPPPPPVSVVEAKSEPMPRFLDGIGSLQAVHQVTVSPELDGRVMKIMLESGAVVKKGDPLVQIDDAPERGDLLNYQAQANLAQATLRRTEALARQDFATQATLDQNKSQLEQANAGITKTNALIAQKLITAPFDGKLGVRQIDLGEYLKAGTPVVTLTNLDTLYANFTLPEQDRGQVEVGQDVEIRVDAYPDRVFTGKVTTIEPQVDPQTRTLKIQATLANPDQLLFPGMYADTRVTLPPQGDSITLPETAVYNTAYGDSVYVLQKDSQGKDGKPVFKAVQSFVKTGPRHDGRISILSGLNPGDQVVKSGQNRLHSGQAVVIGEGESPLKIPGKVPVD